MSLWRLFNKLFGWHYITYHYGSSYRVGRVIKAPNGKFFVKCLYNGVTPLEEYKTHRNAQPLTFNVESDHDS